MILVWHLGVKYVLRSASLSDMLLVVDLEMTTTRRLSEGTSCRRLKAAADSWPVQWTLTFLRLWRRLVLLCRLCSEEVVSYLLASCESFLLTELAAASKMENVVREPHCESLILDLRASRDEWHL